MVWLAESRQLESGQAGIAKVGRVGVRLAVIRDRHAHFGLKKIYRGRKFVIRPPLD